jgi:Tfp pilus assembly protein PilE
MRIVRRLGTCDGQGFLEVIAVIGIFGVLLAVAMPAYMGFRSRSADKEAQATLLAAVWTADAYRANHGSYAGMDTVDLFKIDPRVPSSLAVTSAKRGKYCLTDTVHGKSWSIAGPNRGDAKFTAGAACA